MISLFRFFQRQYCYAICVSIMIILSTAYTLMDAFVIPKAYVIVEPTKSISLDAKAQSVIASNASEAIKPTITSTSYADQHIQINVEKVNKYGAVFYVADIQIADIAYLKTAFAKNVYGKNVTDLTSNIAKQHNAIFAINGDYYGFRNTGLVIRNGIMYRDQGRNADATQHLVIDQKGDLSIIDVGAHTGQELIDMGILQGFTFGPTLVQDGTIVDTRTSRHVSNLNPRTAIGQISSLHYLVIVADGRTRLSKGLSLPSLAQEFVNRDATIAYNLDGGGSATMWLNGAVINNPNDGRRARERAVSDIIYIGYE